MSGEGVEAYFGEAYEAGRRGYRMNRSLDELPYDRFPSPEDRETMVRAWQYEWDRRSEVSAEPEAEVESPSPRF